jgi:hypothetical protein
MGRRIALAFGAAVAAVAVSVGGWYGYWALAGHSQTRQYQVNTNSQQYQCGLVSQERDRVQGFDTATNDAQKNQIAMTFCSVYADLTIVPNDLADAYGRICPAG